MQASERVNEWDAPHMNWRFHFLWQVIRQAPSRSADGVRVYRGDARLQRGVVEASQGHDVRGELPQVAHGDGRGRHHAEPGETLPWHAQGAERHATGDEGQEQGRRRAAQVRHGRARLLLRGQGDQAQEREGALR